MLTLENGLDKYDITEQEKLCLKNPPTKIEPGILLHTDLHLPRCL